MAGLAVSPLVGGCSRPIKQTGIDDIAKGETYILFRPQYAGPAKHAVIYVHGVEESDGSTAWTNFPERTALFTGIADAGIAFLSCTHGGNCTWGNDTVISRIAAAYDFLTSQPNVVATKVCLLATSAGAPGALAWAKRNPALVSCFIGILPVLNLTDVHDANRVGFSSAIDAAYGGAYSELAFGANHNPDTMARFGGFGALPMQIWYGDSDAVVVPSSVTAFADKVGRSCETHLMIGGHAEQTASQVSTSSVLSFISSAD